MSPSKPLAEELIREIADEFQRQSNWNVEQVLGYFPENVGFEDYVNKRFVYTKLAEFEYRLRLLEKGRQ